MEMAEISKQLGGKRDTIFGLSGLGDLIATGFSDYSSNRQYGKELAKTGRCNKESEGCRAFPSLISLLGKNSKELPLFSALEKVIIQNKEVGKTFKKIL